ncbi:MAG: hypothetical protein KC731_20190, partial [Myxococcales bacterium]|nr:hypothetical protein [Myxococcales bacterium]
MRVLALLSFVGWVGGTLAGCRTTTPPEPPLHGEPEALPAPKPAPAVAPAPEPPAPRDDDLVEDDAALLEVLMKSHFGETVLIRRAIIAGDIDAAIPPAEAIAGLEDEARLPEPWKTRVGELKAASDRIRQAPDLPEAAAAMADIGKSCAGCHLELGGPTFDPEPEPVPPAGDLVARMKRHVWASERLWEGLVGPSEAAWREGAAALVEGPL